MRISAPYHDGELFVQEKTGERLTGQRNAAAISDSIIKGALKFIEQQPMVVLGSVDQQGNVWASMLFGTPGFMQAPDDRTVILDMTRTVRADDDALWANIEQDTRVGMLVIELGSRRRLRINGRMTRVAPDELRIDVDEAYPNCPKYIQRRQVVGNWHDGPAEAVTAQCGVVLQAARRERLTVADTFFVASANPRGGLDVSHRGGRPGFVEFIDDRTLRIPDYDGNGMFNTLGNFVVYPHAGLLFIDFDRGRLLQLIGRPIIQWKLDDPHRDTGGTGRYWDFAVERWVESGVPFELAWEFLDYSPYNPVRQSVIEANSSEGG